MLGELAELSLVVAKELASRLSASETPEEAVALAGAYQKVSRVVRLTLALDARLERDAARDAQQARKDAEARDAETQAQARAEQQRRAAAAGPHPVEAKKNRVRGLMNRLLWNESEGDSAEYDVLYDDLSARLNEAARDPKFLDLPIELVAGRIVADMGLSGSLKLSAFQKPAPQPADSG